MFARDTVPRAGRARRQDGAPKQTAPTMRDLTAYLNNVHRVPCAFNARSDQTQARQDGAKLLKRAVMLALSVLSIVPDATAAAEAAAAAVADAATAAAAAAAAAAVAPMARLRLALPTGSPFAGGTPVTIQFRWERSTNLTGSEAPTCRFGKVHTAAQLLGDSTFLQTPAAYGTLPAQSLLCHAPACTSPRCLPQGKVNTVRRLPLPR